MGSVIHRRVTAAIEGEFVVFLIGMRINKLWNVWKWAPVFFAMPRILRELRDSPKSGFLGADQYLPDLSGRLRVRLRQHAAPRPRQGGQPGSGGRPEGHRRQPGRASRRALSRGAPASPRL